MAVQPGSGGGRGRGRAPALSLEENLERAGVPLPVRIISILIISQSTGSRTPPRGGGRVPVCALRKLVVLLIHIVIVYERKVNLFSLLIPLSNHAAKYPLLVFPLEKKIKNFSFQQKVGRTLSFPFTTISGHKLLKSVSSSFILTPPNFTQRLHPIWKALMSCLQQERQFCVFRQKFAAEVAETERRSERSERSREVGATESGLTREEEDVDGGTGERGRPRRRGRRCRGGRGPGGYRAAVWMC